MKANERAPVFAAGEIDVAADPETIWDVLAGIEGWPSWNPEISEAVLEGDLAEGTRLRWKAGRTTITSTLRRIERPRVIGWTGRTMTIDAIHVWMIEGRDGGSVLRTEESWEGLLARLLRGTFQKIVQKAIEGGLRMVKAEAERRAGRR